MKLIEQSEINSINFDNTFQTFIWVISHMGNYLIWTKKIKDAKYDFMAGTIEKKIPPYKLSLQNAKYLKKA